MSSATTITSTNTSELSSLEAKIKLLTDLNERIQKLRPIPSLLLRPDFSSNNVLPIPQPDSARVHSEFEQLKEVSEKLRSEEVQQALKAAVDSEQKDKTGLDLRTRRHENVQQRPPSPESPQPFPIFQPTTLWSFPTLESPSTALKLEGLADYIKDYNKSQKFRLHIWSPAAQRREDALTVNPTVIRFTIRDVVTVYLTVGHLPNVTTLIIEAATAFGPREKKPPHSQSDYIVYQKLSQQLAKTIQSQPRAPFQLIMILLSSYEDLFVRRCSSCQRVLSAEGHVPPVARVWVHDDVSQGSWDARHVICLRS